MSEEEWYTVEVMPNDLGLPPFATRRLQPEVLYGCNPLFARHVEELTTAGVTHVLDLREEWEWAGEGRVGREAIETIERIPIHRRHLPIADGGNPKAETLTAAVKFIDHALAGGGVVFVHCRAGRERSGAVLLAWMLSRGCDVGELQELAPDLKPLPEQQAAVYEWLRMVDR